MKRSCQRQTQVFDLPVRRMISLVPTPSALNRTISARQTCLCGALRSRASAFSRRRSAGLRVMEIPVRMRQTRMHPVTWESPPGFKCQTQSTSLVFPLVEIGIVTEHSNKLSRSIHPTENSDVRCLHLPNFICHRHEVLELARIDDVPSGDPPIEDIVHLLFWWVG